MWFLRERHEEIEFDFDARGWDLLDLYRGKISARKTLLRIRNLPPESATMRSQNWTVAEHLLAAAIDSLNTANWQRQGDNHAKRPEPVKRPADIAKALKREQTIRERALAQRQRAKAVSDG